MKRISKIITATLLLGFCYNGYCQNVNVNINNHDATSRNNDCPYRINGICSSEDIGGVDARIIYADDCTWAVLTNYNTFPVTVLYEIGNTLDEDEYENPPYISNLFFTRNNNTGNIVLNTSNSTKIKLDQTRYAEYFYEDYEATFHETLESPYIDCSKFYSIKGMIVRKLSN